MMTDPEVRHISEKVDNLSDNVSKMAESITEFTVTVARAEERHINMSDRMERIEENQKGQGRDIGILKEAVQSNTFVSRAAIKVASVIVTALIAGAIAMFYSLRN